MADANKPLPRDHPLIRRLTAKVSIAGDLYRERRISRGELLRCEVDLSLAVDTGPIRPIQIARE